MYYGQISSQLNMVSTTSTVINPTTACGYYSGMWGVCSNWGVNGNYSLYSAWREGSDPRLNTTQTGVSNINMSTGYRYKDRMFSCNLSIAGNGTSNSAVSFLSPFSYSVIGSGAYAYKNQSMSNNQNYITTSAFADYGYVFVAWYLENQIGTPLTTTATVNWYYNSTYGGKNFAYINTLHGQFNVSKFISDRRLKENIRLIGRSVGGFNIYTWTYKNQERDGFGTYQGVMAQEVPHATIEHPDGYLMVDYSKVDVTFKKVYGSIMGN